MHRKLLLCLALVGIALSATNLCVGGVRDGVKSGSEQCDPSALNAGDSAAPADCCDKNCRYRLSSHVCALGEKCFSQTTCTGNSDSCPKDDHFLPNADCDFGGDCYAPPKCDPVARDGTCLDPTPRTAESHYQCYTGVTAECTIDAFCDGDNLDCPNHYASADTVCREAVGDCDEDAHCPGEEADESLQGDCPATTYLTTECAAADNENCLAASNCDGENAACPAQQAANSEVKCSDDVDNTQCINKYYCNGVDTGSDACEPYPAEETVVCDPLAANPEECQAASLCDGVSTGEGSCLVQAADSDTVCNSGTEDSTSCTGVSKCSGNDIGVEECAAVPADSSVVCRDEDACNNEKKCDGENMECPTSYKDDETDCSEEKGCDATEMETAKCTSGVCGNCEHPDVIADPLITGFRHQKFWFEGEAGAYYNFFSQPGVQINCLIKDARAKENRKLTVVGAVGFITATNKVTFDAVNGPLGKFIVNGKNVTFNAKQNMMDINDCVQMAWAPTSVLFSSAEFELVFAFKSANPKEAILIPYINTKFVHVSGDVNKMSGVVGYTARDVKSRQHPIDAKVTDILSHDAPLSTFSGAALSCEAGMKRSDNQMGAATQHQLDDLKKFTWIYS